MDSVLGLVRHSGNDGLFKAIEMSLLATASGQPLHLHAEGLRGTGKTTIMRAVRRVLPRIRRIKHCLYNCDPACPHCPEHRALSPEDLSCLGEEWVPMPFLEISHSAKVGTVVGSINLSRLVSPTQPEAALLPGTIPQAHRGIIFVDEINRLAETAPELADILLDVMGTKPGRVQIEETGLPAVELPVQVTVWAASNPDEDPGPLEDIRRQLSDRFDFVIYTDRPGDTSVVEEILAAAGGAGWHRPLSPVDETQAELFRSRLATQIPELRGVQVPKHLRQQIAEIYSRFNVESLRAVQAIQLGMRLAACLEHRHEPTMEDLARITPLALRHRVDQETIKKVTGHLTGMGPRPDAGLGMPTAPLGKPRFPSISFGGAAVDAPLQPLAPESLQAGPGRGDRPYTGAGAAPQRPEWSTQYPPVPGAQPNGPDGWFSRTLAELRRNLGLNAAEPARRPGEGAARAPEGEPGQRGAGAPRPGRLYQRAEGQHGSLTGRPGHSPLHTGQAGGEREKGTGTQSAPRGGGDPGALGDPLKSPPEAPPNPARSIGSLQVHELIRTEEELGRR
jgi:magnesium chelatase subunit I